MASPRARVQGAQQQKASHNGSDKTNDDLQIFKPMQFFMDLLESWFLLFLSGDLKELTWINNLRKANTWNTKGFVPLSSTFCKSSDWQEGHVQEAFPEYLWC